MILPTGVRIAWRAVPAGAPRRETSRALVAELLPGARIVSRCPSCGGDHGRVRTEGKDAAVSVSYAPGWAVVAVSRDHVQIGIDAVPADAGGLERVLPGEADARAWARIEAVLKADGRGLRVDPRRVRVVADAEGWTARIAPDEGERCDVSAVAESVGSGPHEWRGWDLDGPDGVVAALAAG